MLEKKIYPQQLVINWAEGGVLANAHLVRSQVVLEDGEVISTVSLSPLPRSISDFDGDNLKLGEVAEQVKASGVTTISSLTESVRALQKLADARSQEIDRLCQQLDHANEANANAARELADTQDQLRMANESNRRMALDVDVAKHERETADARLSSTRTLLLETQEKYAQAAERVAELERMNGNA